MKKVLLTLMLLCLCIFGIQEKGLCLNPFNTTNNIYFIITIDDSLRTNTRAMKHLKNELEKGFSPIKYNIIYIDEDNLKLNEILEENDIDRPIKLKTKSVLDYAKANGIHDIIILDYSRSHEYQKIVGLLGEYETDIILKVKIFDVDHKLLTYKKTYAKEGSSAGFLDWPGDDKAAKRGIVRVTKQFVTDYFRPLL